MFEYLIEFTYNDEDGEIVYGDILYEIENEITDFDKLEKDSIEYITKKYPESANNIKITAMQQLPQENETTL